MVKAQSEKPSFWSEDQKCVAIMLDSKIGAANMDSLLFAIVNNSKNKEKLRQLLIEGFEGKNLNTAIVDVNLQNEIDLISDQMHSMEMDRLLKLCHKHDIDINVYKSFKKRWQSDFTYQQSFRAFIENKLKL